MGAGAKVSGVRAVRVTIVGVERAGVLDGEGGAVSVVELGTSSVPTGGRLLRVEFGEAQPITSKVMITSIAIK